MTGPPPPDRVLAGRALVRGEADADLLWTDEPLSFWGGYDAETGEIIDRRHPLSGRVAAGLALAIPETRGSSTTTAVLLEAVGRGTAPVALLSRGSDTFLALAAVVAEELYERAPPVIALAPEDFDSLRGAARVRIAPDGAVAIAAASG